jgi:phosphoglucomutase
MAETVSPNAGKKIDPAQLVNIPRLVTAYFTGKPDLAIQSQRVAFGTSGHRGSSFDNAFNETHILAISQAICLHRRREGVDGPMFIGIDTHALSVPALASALEVFAAHEVEVMLDQHDGYTPTPVISHAILGYNRTRKSGLADGVVITPSHNPPEDGGFKYNGPNGGPADNTVTQWIERTANALIADNLKGLRRMPYQRALKSAHLHRRDFIGPYVADLKSIIDMDAIRSAGVRIGIDPLGGASTEFWQPIIEHYRIEATLVSNEIDPTFRFMTADWDGRIRMDCSSPYAMARLIALRDKFDIAFANDTDADRHGIVTKSSGLMNPNHYLAAAIAYLFSHRPDWKSGCGIGKTMVSSAIIDRVATSLGRRLDEVPVGFKWFVDGLGSAALGFAGEESAGASFLRKDGTVWTTDKDGLILGLLAAEITAKTGKDPGQAYDGLTRELGRPFYQRIDAPASSAEKTILKDLTPEQLGLTELAGEPVRATLNKAPGNGAAFGGVKVTAASGWFALRPSGTEEVYKLYAESFQSEDHLQQIQREAEATVARLLGRGSDAKDKPPIAAQ